jgi:hypothetical protein
MRPKERRQTARAISSGFLEEQFGDVYTDAPGRPALPTRIALIRPQRYAHAKQFKRATRALRSIRTILGRVIRDVTRKIVGRPELADQRPPILTLAQGDCVSASRSARQPGILHIPRVKA